MIGRLLPYLDIAAVLCLTAIPWFADAMLALVHTNEFGQQQMPNELGRLTVDCLRASVPILVIMHLRRVDWSVYGFKPFHPYKDLIDGILLAVGCILICFSVAALFYFAEIAEFANGDSPKPVFQSTNFSIHSVLMVLAASASVAFTEELAMRSYLITRILDFRVSAPIAIVTTSLVFASYHIYQGMTAMVSIFLIGIVLGLYFQRMRRFAPVFIAHFSIDVIAMISNMRFEG